MTGRKIHRAGSVLVAPSAAWSSILYGHSNVTLANSTMAVFAVAVYRTAGSGGRSLWVELMTKNGFQVEVPDVSATVGFTKDGRTSVFAKHR